MLLSAASIALNYGYDDNISLLGGEVYTFDDLNYFNNNILTNALDITLNKGELLVLTTNTTLSDKISTPSLVNPSQYVSNSLITDNTGSYYLYANTGGILSFTSSVSAATVFNIVCPTFNTLQLYYSTTDNLGNVTNNYIISNGINKPLSAGSINQFSNPLYYTFTTLFSGSYFSLFNAINNQIISLSANSLVPQTIVSQSSNQLEIPSNCIFNITRFHLDNAYGETQTYGQSDLVQYSRLDNSLTIALNSGELPFNYLISAPFKNLFADGLNENNYIDANINILKNYYSPQYVQANVFNKPLRYYTKIYTGLNQTEGYDKVYLGYNSNVAKITFNKDQDNYFHYPYGAPTIPLSSSTLINYGAWADVTPNRSDRVIKKVADYAYYSSWGNSVSGVYYPSTGTYNRKGVYFCSWLSAGADSTVLPVWMDRFYDPKAVNQYGISYTAISALSGILTDSSNNYPNLIWDAPSNNTFEPGVLYYYHRIGDNDNEMLVQSLSGLTYYIDNFGNVLYNQVTGLSAGVITSFTDSNSGIDTPVKTPYYITNGTYGTINTNINDFVNNSGNTLSVYLYQKDWTNITGDQIIGNYFNGGIGLFVNNPILTPYFTVAAAPNTLYIYNTELGQISYEPFATLETSAADPLSGSSFILKCTYDRSFYIVDNYSDNKYISTFDPDGLLTNKVALTAFDSTITNEIIVDAVLTSDYTLSNTYVITKTRNNATSCCYRKFLTNGILVSAVSASNYNNFTIDNKGNPIFYNSAWASASATIAINSCIDKYNNVYTLSSCGSTNVLAQNNQPILTVNTPEYINCDYSNYVWITYDSTHLAKVNSSGKVLWSKQINTNDTIISVTSNRVINFISELDSSNTLQTYALILDGKSQTIYKVDTNGNLINKTSVPGLIPNGDSTGYDYQRKYIAPFSNEYGIRANLVAYDTTLTNPIPIYSSLNYDARGLAPGWHHFAVTYDNTNIATLYVDGNMVNRSNKNYKRNRSNYVLHSIYNYKNNPQMVVGASNFKNSTLNQWIDLPDRYLFNGRIADIRFYNITLSRSDIKALSNHYLYNQFNDITWLMPTGIRGYIDEIQRFFLHRLPGSKSQFFDIKIKNSGIAADNVRTIVENNIQTAVNNIAPAYVQLRNIIWE